MLITNPTPFLFKWCRGQGVADTRPLVALSLSGLTVRLPHVSLVSRADCSNCQRSNRHAPFDKTTATDIVRAVVLTLTSIKYCVVNSSVSCVLVLLCCFALV